MSTPTHTCAWTHLDTGTNMHKHHTQIHEKNEQKNQTYSYYHRACVIYFLKYISITAKNDGFAEFGNMWSCVINKDHLKQEILLSCWFMNLLPL